MTRQLSIEQIEAVFVKMNAEADAKGKARGVERDAIGRSVDPKEGSNVATEHMQELGIPYREIGKWLRPQMARSYAKLLAMIVQDPAHMDILSESMLGAEFLTGLELGLMLAREYPE